VRVRFCERPGKIVLIAAAFACVLTSCASRQPATHLPSSRPALVRDTHLIGTWRVSSVQVGGSGSVHADSATTASLQFRRDGLLIVNSEVCGAPHFTTARGHIDLYRPSNSDCAFSRSGTRISLHIAEAVDDLARHSPIAYTTQGNTELSVMGGKYRVLLVRGAVLKPRTPTVGPSTPAPYSGGATTSPPS